MGKAVRPNVYIRSCDNYRKKKGEEESSEGQLQQRRGGKDRKIEPSTTTGQFEKKETARAAFHLERGGSSPSGKPRAAETQTTLGLELGFHAD